MRVSLQSPYLPEVEGNKDGSSDSLLVGRAEGKVEPDWPLLGPTLGTVEDKDEGRTEGKVEPDWPLLDPTLGTVEDKGRLLGTMEDKGEVEGKMEPDQPSLMAGASLGDVLGRVSLNGTVSSDVKTPLPLWRTMEPNINS